MEASRRTVELPRTYGNDQDSAEKPDAGFGSLYENLRNLLLTKKMHGRLDDHPSLP